MKKICFILIGILIVYVITIFNLIKENKEIKQENLLLVEENQYLKWELDEVPNIIESRKDDVVSEIKRVLDIWENKPNEIATLDLEEILRMLGEIDE